MPGDVRSLKTAVRRPGMKRRPLTDWVLAVCAGAPCDASTRCPTGKERRMAPAPTPRERRRRGQESVAWTDTGWPAHGQPFRGGDSMHGLAYGQGQFEENGQGIWKKPPLPDSLAGWPATRRRARKRLAGEELRSLGSACQGACQRATWQATPGGFPARVGRASDSPTHPTRRPPWSGCRCPTGGRGSSERLATASSVGMVGRTSRPSHRAA